MTQGGKYLPLAQYFKNCNMSEIQLTFSEIERILHDKLPKSAREYPAWWSNDKGETHTHARAWLDEGYQTHSLSFTSEVISFSKSK